MARRRLYFCRKCGLTFALVYERGIHHDVLLHAAWDKHHLEAPECNALERHLHVLKDEPTE